MTLTQNLHCWRRAMFDAASGATKLFFPVFCSLLIAVQSGAETPDPAPGFTPYSISSLPRSPLREGIGNTTFPINTSSKQAQIYFNQGVNLLHAFWDFEAYRSFAAAASLDPEAIMPHWGIVSAIPLSTEHDLAPARAASLKRLVELLPKADDREARYVRALLSLSRVEPYASEVQYETEMRQLISRYPKDEQARLFLALFLMKGYDAEGHPRPGQGDSEALLRPLVAGDSTNTAAHHYWIHSSEYGDLPGRARASAKKLVSLAPNAGHLVHMPGHIDFLLGDFAAAQEHFYKAYLVDRAYLDAEGIAPVDHWNFIHNVDFMVTSEAELGRFQRASRWGETMLSIKIPSFRSRSSGRWYIFFEARTSLIRLYMRYGLWDKVIVLAKQLLSMDEGSEAAKTYYQILLRFAQLRSACDLPTSATCKASPALGELEALVYALQKSPVEAGERHHVHLARSLSKVFLNEARAFAEHERSAALQWIKAAQEAHKEVGYREPPRYFRPVEEAELEIRARSKGPDPFLEKAFRKKTAKANPWIHLLAARWYLSKGQESKAKAHYQAVLSVWKKADRNLPAIVEARRALNGS